MLNNKEVIRRVEEIYKWLDEQLAAKFTCAACGKCCDFESFGHRLYVTTPEMLYFADKVGTQNIKQMTTSRCPWQIDGPSTSLGMVSLSNHKCTVYPYRFASCRIFHCKGDADFQSDLTETTLKKFKSLCEEFRIPYRYMDLPTALKNFSPSRT